jgi:hypothetical protein
MKHQGSLGFGNVGYRFDAFCSELFHVSWNSFAATDEEAGQEKQQAMKRVSGYFNSIRGYRHNGY